MLSHIGSFTNIRGGWAYPGLVRKTKDKPKPIKVYLQDGKNDLNNLFGNWPLANSDLAAALKFAGYEHQFVMTEERPLAGNTAASCCPTPCVGCGRMTMRRASEKPRSPPPAPLHQPADKWQPCIRRRPARDDVPHGKVEAMPPFESKIFPNTVRDWAIYVPAQYDAAKPAARWFFKTATVIAISKDMARAGRV